jgi:hypothetical protein
LLDTKTDFDAQEKLRRFWMGKTPSVKKAVMEYVNSENKLSQRAIADKYNVSLVSIRINAKQLVKQGLITTLPYPHNLAYCVICGKDVSHNFPRLHIESQKQLKTKRRKGVDEKLFPKPESFFVCEVCANASPILAKIIKHDP